MSFTSFSTNASFCPRTNRLCHRYMGCHISWVSSGLWQLLNPSLFCMTLTVLRSTALIPCRMFRNLGVSDIFPMIRLGLCDFGKNITEVKCPSHHILSGHMWYFHDATENVNLYHLVKVVSTRSLYCTFALSLFYPLEVNHSLALRKKGYWWELSSTSQDLETSHGPCPHLSCAWAELLSGFNCSS